MPKISHTTPGLGEKTIVITATVPTGGVKPETFRVISLPPSLTDRKQPFVESLRYDTLGGSCWRLEDHVNLRGVADLALLILLAVLRRPLQEWDLSEDESTVSTTIDLSKGDGAIGE
jgi:hypothetical protein